MDEKARHKSHYMKKYDKSTNSNLVIKVDERPAGAGNHAKFILDGGGNHGGGHLNMSRKRILNDFVSKKTGSDALNEIVNRNKSNALRMQNPQMGGDNMAYYENNSPSSVTIGPGSSPVRQPQALIANQSFER